MKNLNLALIFDFDDTLVPDSTTLFLEHYRINAEDFWLKDVKKLVLQGYDPTTAFLTKFIKLIGPDKPLGELTNADLNNYGKQLNKKFYPGLSSLLKDLKKLVDVTYGYNIDFYVVSGGLKEIITGTKLIKDHFSAVYACELGDDPATGVLKYIKRCVNFTEKTRYLFEINKGLDPAKTRKDPYLVNKDIPEHERRIPFENMIYVGDGLTDIPCFSLIKNGSKNSRRKGYPFAVFDKDNQDSAKRSFQNFLSTSRVVKPPNSGPPLEL